MKAVLTETATLFATQTPCALERTRVEMPLSSSERLKVCTLVVPAGKLSVRLPPEPPRDTVTTGFKLVTVTDAAFARLSSLGMVTVTTALVWPGRPLMAVCDVVRHGSVVGRA